MAHQHPVKDTDLHFVIDPVTRVIKNNSGKIVIMQHDHQSEILTFELPRYIDTHDMSLSNTVRVHYINIGSSSKYEPVSGVYEITDLQIDPENENLVTCSWTLTNNTTQLEGTLNFIIRFSCLTGDTIDYSWSTAIYSGIIVAKTIDSSDYVMTAIPDILEQWKASLKGDPFTYEDFTPEQLEGLRGPAGIIISETEPTKEDHPVWIRPSGEYIVENLGISGASIGQVPVVKTVDASGVPTEWEAGDSKPFVVTVTYGNNTLTADKTHAEIVAAYAAGAQINAKIVNYPGVIVPSILPLYVNNSDTEFIFSGSGALNGRAMAMTAIDTNGSWRVSLMGLAMLDDIPSGGSEWIKLGDVTVNQTAEFVPLSFESGIVTIDTNAGGYDSLPSSGTINCIVHTIDVTSKTSPVVGMLKPKNYEAGTFEFYNRDSVFQSSAAYDPTTYKISIANVAMVVMENIPTDYKRYKSRVTTPAFTNHGIRTRYACDGFTEIGFGADSSTTTGGGAIIETEFYPHPYDENYVYRRIRTAYGKFYGGGSGNEFQSFELIKSGSGKTKPRESGEISFKALSMIFVNGTRFELWGTNDD